MLFRSQKPSSNTHTTPRQFWILKNPTVFTHPGSSHFTHRNTPAALTKKTLAVRTQKPFRTLAQKPQNHHNLGLSRSTPNRNSSLEPFRQKPQQQKTKNRNRKTKNKYFFPENRILDLQRLINLRRKLRRDLNRGG